MSTGSDLPVSMLVCSLCKSLYREPRTLPCLHSFCHPCLQQLTSAHNGQVLSTLDCPDCGQQTTLPSDGVSGLTFNDFLARICLKYVDEVEKTLGTGIRRGSPGSYSPEQGSPSPVHSDQNSPTHAQFAASVGRHSYSVANVSMAGLETEKVLSPTQRTAFNFDVRRGSAPYTVSATQGPLLPRLAASASTQSIQQAGRRVPSECIKSRGVGMRRRMSTTTPEVMRIYEKLQRRLNSLQSASLQITYSLENVNLAEKNWYQKKQDLKRDVQRRSAQLQFFIKRQERLLLALLDSRDTDEGFTSSADKARSALRTNLKGLGYDRDILKSVLDLATDSELLNLGDMLLASAISQTTVKMDTPELKFKITDEESLEDMMEKDFGCLTTSTVTHDIFVPDVTEQDIPANQDDEETVVTETYVMDMPVYKGAGPMNTTTNIATNNATNIGTNNNTNIGNNNTFNVGINNTTNIGTNNLMATTNIGANALNTTTNIGTSSLTTATTIETNTQALGTIPTRVETNGVANTVIEEVHEEEQKEEQVEEQEEEEEQPEEEEEEEEEESEEEMIVEETIEIIDGKMQVISKTSRPAPKAPKAPKPPKPVSAPKPKRVENTRSSRPEEKSTSRPEMERSPRGRGTDVRRNVNSAAAAQQSTQQTASSLAPSLAPRWGSAVQTTQQATTTQNVDVTSNRPTQSFQMSHTSTGIGGNGSIGVEAQTRTNQEISLPSVTNREEIERGQNNREEKGNTTSDSQDNANTEASSGSATSENIEHVSTLNKFQNFRESLRLRRRELLNSSAHPMPGHQGVVNLLMRERRVQSLDRTGFHRDQPRSSALTHQQPSIVTAPLVRSARVSDSDDSTNGTTGEDDVSLEDGSSVSTAGRGSRPVRRAISAASDKAAKMEFLRENWRQRKELLIQKDAYVTKPGSPPAKDEGAEPGPDKDKPPADDQHMSFVKQGMRSRVTNMAEALKNSGKAEEGRLELRTSGRTYGGTLASTIQPLPPSTVAETPAEAQVLKTVDSILQKKNVPIPDPISPKSPPSPLTARCQDTSQTTISTGAKPSMMVRPRPREPSAASCATATFTSPLETLQEETKTAESPERKPGLRATSPNRDGEGGKDRVSQVKANIRRKKERWRSLSLT